MTWKPHEAGVPPIVAEVENTVFVAAGKRTFPLLVRAGDLKKS